jgi:uncharacterized tellurite resistance protein B-like protein
VLDAIKQFFNDQQSSKQPDIHPQSEEQLAVAVLLVHMGNIDGEFDDTERQTVRQTLQKRFALSDSDVETLMEKAIKRDEHAVDLFSFTNYLKTSLDEDKRIEIIEMLWKVVFADSAVDAHEDNMVWRVAELLGISPRDRIRMRQKVSHETGISYLKD